MQIFNPWFTIKINLQMLKLAFTHVSHNNIFFWLMMLFSKNISLKTSFPDITKLFVNNWVITYPDIINRQLSKHTIIYTILKVICNWTTKVIYLRPRYKIIPKYCFQWNVLVLFISLLIIFTYCVFCATCHPQYEIQWYVYITIQYNISTFRD